MSDLCLFSKKAINPAMTDQKIEVGQDVLSYCGKCKLALNHVIMAMKDENTIGRCECLTCHAKHLYRNPDAPVKKTGTRKKKEVAIPIDQIWAAEINKASGRAKGYSTKDEYHWICPACYKDFKDLFQWKVISK